MRALLTAMFTAVFVSPSVAAEKPNIVLVIADDMAWSDCGAYGNRDVRTPNIDRLAKSSLLFRRAFTATAMCSPTRQQLYTGVFPVRNGAYPNHSQVKPSTKSIVHHLRRLGYRVALAGKKHIGPRASFPFDAGNEAFLTKDREQPFCLIVASHHPHAPWNAGPRDYDPKKLTVPSFLADNPETRKNLAAYYSEITAFDDEVGHWMNAVDSAKLTEKTIFIVTSEQGPQFPGGKWTCYDYGLHVGLIIRWPGVVKPNSTTNAMVQYVDVLPTLIEAAGGKPSESDTGRPGAPDGGNGFDGRSFLRVLKGETEKHDDYVFGVHTTKGIIAGRPYPVRSIRSERFKYIQNLLPDATFQNVVTEQDRAGTWQAWKRDAATNERVAMLVKRYQHRPAEELYDVVADPFELHNLAASPKYQKTLAMLKTQLQAWMKQQGDKGVETEQAVGKKAKTKKKRKPPATTATVIE